MNELPERSDVVDLARALIEAVEQQANWPAVTEEELVAEALAYASSAKSHRAIALVSGIHMGALAVLRGDTASLYARAQGDFTAARAQFIADLRGLIAGSLSAADRKRLSTDGRRIALLPTKPASRLTRQGSSMRMVPTSVTAMFAYVIGVLAEPPYAGDVRECQLERCGKFFRISPLTAGPGRKPSKYCSVEHMEEAHRAAAPERARRSRKAKSRARKRR